MFASASWPAGFLLLIAASASAEPQSSPYVYNSTATNSADLAKEIPCKYVRRNADGSWTFPGTVNMGSVQMSDTTMGRGNEAEILERRCNSPI